MKELCICTSFIRRTPLLVAVAAGSALALAPTSFGAGRTLPGNSTSNVGPHGQVKQIPGAPGVRTPAQKVVIDFPNAKGGGIAGVPANNDCAAAMAIFDGATAFDTVAATTDGPAEAGCGFCCGDNQINQDIWYNYTATQTGSATFALCGSGYDTKVALYDGCGCPVAGAPLACNDDSCGLQSNISASVTAGNCYKLRIGGFTGATGTGTVNISYGGGGGNPACGAAATHDCFTTGGVGCTDEKCCNIVCALDSFCCAVAWDGICVGEAVANCNVVAPANDNCPDRILIGTGDTAFTTVGATTDGPPTACIDVAGDPQVNQDVWFNFFAPTTELYSATTCGSAYDTKMAVYSGCTCPADPGSEVGCNDDACGLQSIVSWDAIAGQCYKIRVGGFGTAVGSGTLHVFAGVPLGPCDDPNNHPCDVAGGPGCSDHDCCVTVCALDPFCCDVSWDGICVGEAAQFCGPPCIFDCPPGSVQEGEPCGSDTNGGCNSTPPVYTQIACGDTVCGDFWAAGGTRDTDWYQFSITQDQTSVNWSVLASFPAVAFILNNDCGNIVLIAQGTGNCPVRAEASGCSALNIGTYVAFVATASFDGLPCGGKDNDYVATLTCTAPCLTDINGDGVTNTGDLLQVINHWGPCP